MTNSISIRNYYLQMCFTLERASFEKVNELYNNKIVSQSSNYANQKLIIPEIEEARKRELPWFPDFEKLFLKAKNAGYVSNIIFHGSIGDFTFNNYSDLDFTIILKDDIFLDVKSYQGYRIWLNELYKLLYYIDPLQHHGPFYLWDKLMKAYDNSILPLMVYKGSWAMENFSAPIKLVQNIESSTRKSLALDLCNNLTNAESLLFKYGYNLFAIKRYLSYLMLIPAFYYTDKGQPCRKENSFDPFYEEFKEIAEPVQIASKLRSDWPEVPSWFKSLAPVFSNSKVSRRGSCLILLNQSMKRVIQKDISPLIPALENKLKEKLCIK